MAHPIKELIEELKRLRPDLKFSIYIPKGETIDSCVGITAEFIGGGDATINAEDVKRKMEERHGGLING